MNYLVILFKNKKKRKIINRFITEENAISFFKKTKNENIVHFEKIIDGYDFCEFELGLARKNDGRFSKYFFKDDLGRQIKLDLEDPDYELIDISKFKVEEKFVDNQKNKKITLIEFYSDYLSTDTIKLVFILNNKIFVQEDTNFKMFTFKTEEECLRFLDSLSKFLIENEKTNCILINDVSSFQKKYLYDLLESNGFDKSVLYRKFTTYRK